MKRKASFRISSKTSNLLKTTFETDAYTESASGSHKEIPVQLLPAFKSTVTKADQPHMLGIEQVTHLPAESFKINGGR